MPVGDLNPQLPGRAVLVVVFVCYFVHGKGAKYCNVRVSVSVFLLAYLKKQQTKLHEIVCTLYMLRVAVSRSSCDDSAVHYALPDLWMMSFFA